MRFFLLSYSRGPNWNEGLPRHKQPLGPHLAYLRCLHEKSQLVMAGPFAEEGGMAIVQTSSVDDAHGIAKADPGIIAGTLLVEVTEWRPIVWDGFSPSAFEHANGPVSVSYSSPRAIGSSA